MHHSSLAILVLHFLGWVPARAEPSLTAAAEELPRESITIHYRIPPGFDATAEAFLSGVSGSDGKVLIAPQKSSGRVSSERWYTATYNKDELSSNPFFYYPFMNGGAFGIFQRSIDVSKPETRIELPATYYTAKWEVPEALSQKLKLHPGSTYLVMLRVVKEKDIGTTYDPRFYLNVPMRKNISDDTFDVQFHCPFLEPGNYEFGVRGGPNHEQILRKRVKLILGQGLQEVTAEHPVNAIKANATQQKSFRFEEADIVPRSAVRNAFESETE
jgi:hypothetical protein